MNKVSRLFEEEKKEAVKMAEKEGRIKEKKELAQALLDVLSLELISEKTGLSIEEVKEIETECKTQERSKEP